MSDRGPRWWALRVAQRLGYGPDDARVLSFLEECFERAMSGAAIECSTEAIREHRDLMRPVIDRLEGVLAELHDLVDTQRIERAPPPVAPPVSSPGP